MLLTGTRVESGPLVPLDVLLFVLLSLLKVLSRFIDPMDPPMLYAERW